jgi:peptidoglycan/LPS O-acetylase OafA/YrhL
MRLEILPLVLGVLIGLVGLGLLFDACAPDDMVETERRRRPRRQRSRGGEALVGLGILALAAALLGRDTWRYTTVAVIAGSVLLLWGLMRNGSYIRGIFARGDVSKPKVLEGPRRIR